MKIRSIIECNGSRMLCTASLVVCSFFPLVSAAAPHWDVSSPGQHPYPLYNGLSGPMAAKDGTLYAINHFTDQQYPTSLYTEVDRWTKCTGLWQNCGGPLGWDPITSVYFSGDYLYVSGLFTMTVAGGGTAINIAKYNVLTEEWSTVGDGSITDEIWAVAVDSNGRVYIGTGVSTYLDTSAHSLLQYWNGTAWTPCGSGMLGNANIIYGYGQVSALTADGTNIYAAGTFDGGVSGDVTTYSTNIIKWDGISWHAIGTPAGYGVVLNYPQYSEPHSPIFRKIVVSGTNVFVTGNFYNGVLDGDQFYELAPIGLDRFSTNGSHVHAYTLHTTLDPEFREGSGWDMAVQNGTLYLAGEFSYIDTNTVIYAVAQFDGSTWSALGSGVSGGTTAYAVAADVNPSHPENAVYVLGDFDHAGGSLIPNGTPVRWVLGADNMSCSVTGRIAAGLNHSLLLKYDGTVWAWGWNYYGQLGNGNNTDSSTPVVVTGLSNIVAISAGWFHNLAVKSDGTLWAWGRNNFGQLGNNSTTDQNVPIQVPNLSTVRFVAAGAYHSVAASWDDLLAWGYNADGELGDGSTNERHVPTQVSRTSGLWYYNVYALAAGAYHTLAIGSGGQLWAWGANSRGQLGDGTTSAKNSPVQISVGEDGGVKAICGGLWHTMALDSDMAYVWTWGDNTYGQLGNGSTGGYNATPNHYWSSYNNQAISAGAAHNLAVANNGSVWTWGYNDHGQLGDNSTTTRSSPVQPSGLSGMTTIAGGGHFSLSAGSGAAIYSWGANSNGQLGVGDTIDRLTPVTVTGFSF